MKTAKQILNDKGLRYDSFISSSDCDAAISAMEELAKQEAIEFVIYFSKYFIVTKRTNYETFEEIYNDFKREK